MNFKNLARALFLVLITFNAFSCKDKGGQGSPASSPEKPPGGSPDPEVEFWLTTADKSVLFKKQGQQLAFGSGASDKPVIEVDSTQTFQSMDGFGYTLTGGSATLIHSLSEAKQDALLRELFLTEGTGIGVSYLRISIGASDLSAAPFTYNDLPPGETDPELEHFSIEMEKAALIPVLKKIIALSPAIKIMGSPWSPPTWMKTNNSFKGGSLKPEYYPAYARYFVKYIQAMKEQGITVDAITIQNEPLHPGNNPSMLMLAGEQADFIKNHLGPAFEAAGISAKIIIYDHNADRPDYPLTILNDPGAKKYVDGSAFHLYGGSISALTQVRNAHPDKHIYFTEQWVGAESEFSDNLQWHVENLIIGAPRNWSRNVLEWNLAADQHYEPHTEGGCTACLGALTIEGETITRNVAYYIIAHASKFVR
ncbi:MAG TPA: glucosylceramidase, partial [Anseongella sp.]|nr:glucosylceramidase [Anseongella sp.]